MPDAPKPSFEQAPPTPERAVETPERGAAFEAPAPALERPAASAPAAASVPKASAPAVRKDPTVRGVESVLEDGLGETYAKMKPALQAKFRKEGERVTARIVAMMRTASVKARTVLGLIADWLKMIPGVNRFYLVQEAKIKTDRILALAEEEKRKRGV
jgi:hypothetical protein